MITLHIKEAIKSSKAWIRERERKELGTLCITVLLRDRQEDASIVFWVGSKAASKLVGRLHAVPSRVMRIN
jgi:predicted transcriptional regulator YheO